MLYLIPVFTLFSYFLGLNSCGCGSLLCCIGGGASISCPSLSSGWSRRVNGRCRSTLPCTGCIWFISLGVFVGESSFLLPPSFWPETIRSRLDEEFISFGSCGERWDLLAEPSCERPLDWRGEESVFKKVWAKFELARACCCICCCCSWWACCCCWSRLPRILCGDFLRFSAELCEFWRLYGSHSLKRP